MFHFQRLMSIFSKEYHFIEDFWFVFAHRGQLMVRFRHDWAINCTELAKEASKQTKIEG
jgi:hypothetical protein